ncbi:MAG: hypothetical protein AAF648_13090 [Pseudomonadota bacterium]
MQEREKRDKREKRLGLALIAGVFTLQLAGCAGAEGTDADTGIQLTFSAATDSEGNCRPERKDRGFVGDTGLYAVRGETSYVLPSGTTEIPFQIVFRGIDDNGFSKDRATTILNHPGACSELSITIDIEFCEYVTPAERQERACPDISVVGDEAFGQVIIKRSDQK